MKDNVTTIPGSGDELRASAEAMKRMLPIIAEIAVELAVARKASFDAHVRAGFSEAQALELCKNLT